MKRIIYALLASALFMPLAYAQTGSIQTQVDGQLKSLRADDAELKQILENHPDVRVAKAKVQLANEELSKIERNLAVKYLSMSKGVELAHKGVEQLRNLISKFEKVPNSITPTELQQLILQLNKFESEEFRQKAELEELIQQKKIDLLTDRTLKNEIQSQLQGKDMLRFDSLHTLMKIESGSTLDKLKSVIDQQIEYSCKEKPAFAAMSDLNNKVGVNVIVRMSDLKSLSSPFRVTLDGKMSLSSWIEMIIDDCNSEAAMMNPILDGQKIVFDAYVRDYGILITYTSKRPQQAMTLREFTALVRAEKAKTEHKK